MPTVADAERLSDLAAFMPADGLELFPAWETLPFERVSPSIETMGRRLRTLWRLRTGDPTLQVVVTARALVQRLGPHVEDAEPILLGAGDQVDASALIESLVTAGYRREYQVEHRGEIVVRGSIIDVFRPPPTCPSASICGATRSSACASSPSPTSVRRSTSTRCRSSVRVSCCPFRRSAQACRAPGSHPAVGSRAVAAPGRRRDSQRARRRGSAWLREHVLFDLVPTTHRCCWSTPAVCVTVPVTSRPRRPIWSVTRTDLGSGGGRRGDSAPVELPRARGLRAPAGPHRSAGVVDRQCGGLTRDADGRRARLASTGG